MKKHIRAYIWLGSIILTSFCGAYFVFAAGNYPAPGIDYFPEFIESYRVDIVVEKDATAHVTESITYDFKDERKHGIYRTIPYVNAPGALQKATYTNISAVNEYGTAYHFTEEHGSRLKLRVGDPDVLVTGKHFYKIGYTVNDGIGWFDDRDEIYWNVTGNEWEVPIKQVEAHIFVPGNIGESERYSASYCGPRGSQAPCMAMQPVYHEDTNTTEFIFGTDPESYLPIGSGMTVAVGFPKGILVAPTTTDYVISYLKQFWCVPVPLLIASLWFRKSFRAYRRRRAFYTKNPIIPEYDSHGHTPLEVAVLTKGRIEQKDISAEIISLAVRGYVTIQNTNDGYSFEGTDKPIDDLPVYDKTLIIGIRGMSTKSLNQNFFMKALDIQKTVAGEMFTAGYTEKIWGIQSSSRWLVLFMGFFLAVNPGIFFWFLFGPQIGFIISGSCILIALISFIFNPRISPLTDFGLEEERKLLGLKLYISVAEAERITFHNAPAKNPALFEELLPYAMIFGLEKEWAKEFETIYTQTPTWYRGGTTSGFSASTFGGSMNAFAVAAGGALFSAPPRSSGGGSGSSGGGSSGGGGGGGGGGSW